MKKIFYSMLLALLVAVSGSAVKSYAMMDYPSDLPELPVNVNAHNIVWEIQGVYRAVSVVSDVPEDMHLNRYYYTSSSHERIRFECNVHSVIKFYELDSNNNWIFKTKVTPNTGTTTDITSVISGLNIVYSTVDIYDDDTGELVFPLPPVPLHQIVGEVATEATMEEVTNLDGTIMILVLCGVGCLALVIILNLFGKVLPRFQAK